MTWVCGEILPYSGSGQNSGELTSSGPRGTCFAFPTFIAFCKFNDQREKKMYLLLLRHDSVQDVLPALNPIFLGRLRYEAQGRLDVDQEEDDEGLEHESDLEDDDVPT